MGVEDYKVVQVATMGGRKNVVVQMDVDGDHVHINADGYISLLLPEDVTDVSDAIVLPLPEVTNGAGGNVMYGTLRAGGNYWSGDVTDASLEASVSRGAAAAAVLLHRQAQREATPDLTDDLRSAFDGAWWASDAHDAAGRIRDALARGARLVEGEDQ